jgi:hypothetical protein
MIRISTQPIPRICQGDVLREVEYLERVDEQNGIVQIQKILFPFVIVLTQDCDLAQDETFRCTEKETQDKWLISVLLGPMYNAEHFYTGEHLEDIVSYGIVWNRFE